MRAKTTPSREMSLTKISMGEGSRLQNEGLTTPGFISGRFDDRSLGAKIQTKPK